MILISVRTANIFHTLLLGSLLSTLSFPFLYAAEHQNVIETTGMGVADPRITNETQRRATARDAAIVDAQEKMVKVLQSQHPNAVALEDKASQARILKGAEVMSTKWENNNQCRVTLRLNEELFQTQTGIPLTPR